MNSTKKEEKGSKHEAIQKLNLLKQQYQEGKLTSASVTISEIMKQEGDTLFPTPDQELEFAYMAGDVLRQEGRFKETIDILKTAVEKYAMSYLSKDRNDVSALSLSLKLIVMLSHTLRIQARTTFPEENLEAAKKLVLKALQMIQENPTIQPTSNPERQEEVSYQIGLLWEERNWAIYSSASNILKEREQKTQMEKFQTHIKSLQEGGVKALLQVKYDFLVEQQRLRSEEKTTNEAKKESFVSLQEEEQKKAWVLVEKATQAYNISVQSVDKIKNAALLQLAIAIKDAAAAHLVVSDETKLTFSQIELFSLDECALPESKYAEKVKGSCISVKQMIEKNSELKNNLPRGFAMVMAKLQIKLGLVEEAIATILDALEKAGNDNPMRIFLCEILLRQMDAKKGASGEKYIEAIREQLSQLNIGSDAFKHDMLAIFRILKQCSVYDSKYEKKKEKSVGTASFQQELEKIINAIKCYSLPSAAVSSNNNDSGDFDEEEQADLSSSPMIEEKLSSSIPIEADVSKLLAKIEIFLNENPHVSLFPAKEEEILATFNIFALYYKIYLLKQFYVSPLLSPSSLHEQCERLLGLLEQRWKEQTKSSVSLLVMARHLGFSFYDPSFKPQLSCDTLPYATAFRQYVPPNPGMEIKNSADFSKYPLLFHLLHIRKQDDSSNCVTNYANTVKDFCRWFVETSSNYYGTNTSPDSVEKLPEDQQKLIRFVREIQEMLKGNPNFPSIQPFYFALRLFSQKYESDQGNVKTLCDYIETLEKELRSQGVVCFSCEQYFKNNKSIADSASIVPFRGATSSYEPGNPTLFRAAPQPPQPNNNNYNYSYYYDSGGC